MHPPFIRTRTTWLGYSFLAYFTLSQALISAIMPFLRVEIGLSYTLTGMFMSANALGMALAGLSADRLAAHLGRKPVFWTGVGASLAGLAALALGQQAPILLAGSFVAGYFGGLCR